MCCVFFFSSRRLHTRCALVTGVQTCALPICLRVSLESLGYWPLPDVQPAQEESIAEPDAQAEQALADDVDRNVAAFIDRSIDQARTSQADDTQVDSAQVAAPIPVAAGGRGGFEIPGDEIDDEIREVFLEEFGEEIEIGRAHV